MYFIQSKYIVFASEREYLICDVSVSNSKARSELAVRRGLYGHARTRLEIALQIMLQYSHRLTNLASFG